jgi:hypothetical protein
MRLAERLRVERRLSSAEDIVAERAMARIADLLRAEVVGMSDERAHDVLLAARRASESGAAPRDAVRVLLGEIARVDAALAAHIGRAVGVSLPSPVAQKSEC